MIVIPVENVNAALYTTLTRLETDPQVVTRMSRNGPVREFATAVTTMYTKPTERVLFNAARSHNSIFAWAETLWMLAGRDDLGFLLPMNKNMATYSDDGKLVRGSAYGRRWRSWFGHDQLLKAVESLRADKDTRRVVLQHWDAATDNVVVSKDIPCNTVVYPYIRPDVTKKSGYRMDLTVSCRSNDIVYGAYGSNAVHFSILQELLAGAVGVDVGLYNQVSNSLHLYTDFEIAKKVEADRHTKGVDHMGTVMGTDYDYYGVTPHPLLQEDETFEDFLEDNSIFFTAVDNGCDVHMELFKTTWFRTVWTPIWRSFIVYKYEENSYLRMQHVARELEECAASDLRLDIARRYVRLNKESAELFKALL